MDINTPLKFVLDSNDQKKKKNSFFSISFYHHRPLYQSELFHKSTMKSWSMVMVKLWSGSSGLSTTQSPKQQNSGLD